MASFDVNALMVIHNESENRFEVSLGGPLALATYRLREGSMIINHTEVPPPFEGRGIAAKITRAALDYARAHNLKVVPSCPYTAAFLRKHAEYHDLLSPEDKQRFVGF
jgi:predicted GNAT family acetyltransferase